MVMGAWVVSDVVVVVVLATGGAELPLLTGLLDVDIMVALADDGAELPLLTGL
jgi:hypothetical protein